MIRKLQITIIMCFFISSITLIGQKDMRIADKQFDLQVYELAIENYKSALKESPLNYHAMSRVAESYLMINDIASAASWYEKLITMKDVYSNDILNYAHTLKKFGIYSAAKKQYEAYREVNDEIGAHYAESCDYAIQILLVGNLHKATSFVGNSKNSEFGSAFHRGQMVFSSFNDQINRRVYKRNKSLIQTSGNQLYVLDDSGENFNFLRPEVKEIYFIGPVAYDENGENIAYTRNNFYDGRIAVKGNETSLSIYTATSLNTGDFVNEVAFPFNSSMYANAFPYLTNNGKTMYFASNMIGGFGGFDLYITHFVEGAWTIPENLGSQINSPGNEITPYISDNQLFFASDYHFGLGGYDIFFCDSSFGSWTFPQNIGEGINSSRDDYFFAVNPSDGKMYFSSNRNGGQGKDDIYEASLNENPQFALQVAEKYNTGTLPGMAIAASNIVNTSELTETAEKEEDQVVNSSIKDEIITTDNTSNEIVTELEEMPPAVSLKALEKETEAFPEMSFGKTVSFEKGKIVSGNNFFSMSLARKVAHGEVILDGGNVYFIQLASLSRSNGDFSRFKSFVKYGNLYKVYKTNTVKIRLGHYNSRDEAMDVLIKIRNSGIKDAFLVSEPLITSQLELIASPFSNDIYQEDNTFVSSKKTSDYKIRLASYTDPLWFDAESVADLGEIEQWTKGQWTIFVLSGYTNIEEAKKAQIKAINRGFSDAHVVIDNEGILEKLKEN